MLSPALASKAAQSSSRKSTLIPELKSDVSSDMSLSHQYTVMEQVFRQDKTHLDGIRSYKDRVNAKRECLARYHDWLETCRVQDLAQAAINRPMYIWLLLWHIDVGQWERALVLAEPALKARFSAPGDFHRSLIEVVVEEISNGILASGQAVQSQSILSTLIEWSHSRDIHDFIRAKLYKASGLAFSHDVPLAIEYLEKAYQLNPKIGVQRILKTLIRPAKTAQNKVRDSLHGFSLSANAAAKLLGMTTPTFLRHAKKHPEQLPHLAIPLGSRTFYRFNPVDVRAFRKTYLVKEKQ